MKATRPPYSAMFHYPDGSVRYRLARFPSFLEGILKRSRAQMMELYKGDQMLQISKKLQTGDISHTYTNQLSLF